MNNTSGQAYRPSTSELYIHQPYVPTAEHPDDDRVGFLTDIVSSARSVPDPRRLPRRDPQTFRFDPAVFLGGSDCDSDQLLG